MIHLLKHPKYVQIELSPVVLDLFEVNETLSIRGEADFGFEFICFDVGLEKFIK